MLIGDFFYTHRLTARDNGFLILFTDIPKKPISEYEIHMKISWGD
jgi:hypothetical protein